MFSDYETAYELESNEESLKDIKLKVKKVLFLICVHCVQYATYMYTLHNTESNLNIYIYIYIYLIIIKQK